MPTRYQLITFDVYTALFDIQSSLIPVVQRDFGAQTNAPELVRTWRARLVQEWALI